MSTDLHTLSGAYAIDALSATEADSFAAHLDGCPACRDELRELQEVAARMGASESTPPPSALKARVLAAADRQSQLPPTVTSVDFAHPRRWTSRIVGAAAAVILVISVGIGYSQMQDRNEPPVAAGSVAQVFKAPDAHTATVQTSDGTKLRIATSADFGQMAVDTDSLRSLTSKQVYQMWALHNGRATSVGVIDDVAAGKVMPIPTYGTTIAITVEPAGGSKQPTAKPIVEVNPQSV